MGKSLQIQSVLYKNDKSGLFKAMDSLHQAIINSKETNCVLTDFALCYGDASDERIFSEREVEEISAKYTSSFKFEYLFFNLNTGSAKGHNIIGKDCNTDYMQIMNPDVIISPGFFSAIMLPFSDEHLNVGMVEARQTPIEHPKEYDVKTGETSWATTACTVFKSDIFHELNGFDSDTFFMYCDDLDFSWRIRLAGKSIIYQPLAPVFHAKRLSCTGLWQATSAETYYSAEAALFMAYKWSNPKLFDKIYNDFIKSDDENLKKAAAEFMRRKSNGTLPDQLDADHKVATFHGNLYTKHRFAL